MRDTLPNSPRFIECGILNLDSIRNAGTHWTCWIKKQNTFCYFDSFGVQPPREFETYVDCDILYSTYQIQKIGDVICGQLCLQVLYDVMVLKLDFHDVLLKLL